MMQGLCKEELLDEACNLFRKMEDDGCFADNCSFNIIMKGCIWNNDIVKAMELLREAREKGFAADNPTAEMIIDLLSPSSTLDEKNNAEMIIDLLSPSSTLDEKNKDAVRAALGLVKTQQ